MDEPGRAAKQMQRVFGDSGIASQDAAPTDGEKAESDPSERQVSGDTTGNKPIFLATPSATVRHRHAQGDPFEGFNRKMFAVQDGLDRALIRPVALGYRHVVPKPIRGGLRHFLSNLTEPIVFLNYLFQLKPGKAAETMVRFTINSTIGVAGALDVAKLPSIGLPHRPNGFGNTLGFYGVKPGPYLFIPLVGPTDLRDLVGGQADNLTIPVLAAGKPFNQPAYLIPSAVIGGLDQREQNDDDLRALYAGAVDRYASLRSVFLQDRQGEIDALHHRADHQATAPLLDEPLDDPERKVDVRPEAEAKAVPSPENGSMSMDDAGKPDEQRSPTEPTPAMF